MIHQTTHRTQFVQAAHFSKKIARITTLQTLIIMGVNKFGNMGKRFGVIWREDTPQSSPTSLTNRDHHGLLKASVILASSELYTQEIVPFR